MTHDVPEAAPSEVASAAGAGPDASHTSSIGRLIGLDMARGLAVFGMYAAHIGPEPSVGGPLGWAMEVARGRSSALFALLAGFTLVRLTGQPRTGRAGRQTMGRALIRSAALIALGYALTSRDTPVDVILPAYGMVFVLALPLYRLRALTLAIIAAATVLVLPQVLILLRSAVEGGSWADAVIAHDPPTRITGSDGIVELFIIGEYPVLTWLAFVIAGMAVARLDLTRPGIRAKVTLISGAPAALGYAGSWLALHLVPGTLAAVSAATDGGSAASACWSGAVGDPTTSTPGLAAGGRAAQPDDRADLGNAGVGLMVVAVCLAARRHHTRPPDQITEDG